MTKIKIELLLISMLYIYHLLSEKSYSLKVKTLQNPPINRINCKTLHIYNILSILPILTYII